MAGHGGGHSGGGGHESSKSHGGRGGHGGGGGGLGLEVFSWDAWKDIFTGEMSRKEKTSALLAVFSLLAGGNLSSAIISGVAGSEVTEEIFEMLPKIKESGGKKSAGAPKAGGHH